MQRNLSSPKPANFFLQTILLAKANAYNTTGLSEMVDSGIYRLKKNQLYFYILGMSNTKIKLSEQFNLQQHQKEWNTREKCNQRDTKLVL